MATRSRWCSIVLLLLLLTTACGSDGATSPPPKEKEPEFRTVRFMTYNIRRTGREEEPWRLPLVMDVIRAHNPDVIGLEEAHLWEDGEPPLADSVATALGMNTTYAPIWEPDCNPPPCGSGRVILTRFAVVRSDTLYTPISLHPILRAVLVDGEGRPWIVYVAHLSSASATAEEKRMEREAVRNLVVAGGDTLSVALGDWNMPYDELAEFLPGWTCLAYNTRLSILYHASTVPIDHIWLSGDVSDVLAHGSVDLYSVIGDKMDQASDHHPVQATIRLRKR